MHIPCNLDDKKATKPPKGTKEQINQNRFCLIEESTLYSNLSLFALICLYVCVCRASGEAQIAVVDLLGILSGIGLCTLVGTSRNSILVAYILLSMVDISAIYLEIRAVVFTVLNHERTHLLVRDYVACGSDPVAMAGVPAAVRSRNSSLSTMVALRLSDALPTPVSIAAAARSEEGVAVNGGRRGERAASTALRAAGDGNAEREGNPLQTVVEKEGTVLRSSPSTVSRRENIFMPSKLTTHTFKTWSKVRNRRLPCVFLNFGRVIEEVGESLGTRKRTHVKNPSALNHGRGRWFRRSFRVLSTGLICFVERDKIVS